MVEDYSEFIMWMLDQLELKYDYIIREDKGDYILTQSILGDDSNPSMTLFINDGYVNSYNSLINGKQRISLKEATKMTGYFRDYVTWLLKENGISTHHINSYRDLLIKKQLKEFYDHKKFGKYLKLFSSMYLSMADILSIDEVKRVDSNKFKSSNKKKKKSSIDEIEVSEEEYQKCKEYIEGRKLEIIEGKVEPVKLQFSSGYSIIGVAFRYPDNEFSKFRLLSDSFRYCSKGRYEDFFIAKDTDDKSVAYVLEGEICSLSFAKVVNNSVFAMHNCSSISSSGLNQLEDYSKIVILVDKDNFSKVAQGLIDQVKNVYPNKDITCISKFDSNLKSLDFNSYLIEKGEEELKKYVDSRLKV